MHCDYKLNNLTVLKSGSEWRVSGLFDLHEAQFGDGARDLARQGCSYLDTDPELARVFFDSYLRMPLTAQTSRNCWHSTSSTTASSSGSSFRSPSTRAAWTVGKTFRGWAERYVEGLLGLL